MYKPHRDERFDYVWEVMEFIEERQCKTCAFRVPEQRSEYAMCEEIAAELIEMRAVEALDDRGDDGVVCTSYRDADLAEPEHPDQLRLL